MACNGERMITIKNRQWAYQIDSILLEKKVTRVLKAVGYPQYDLNIWFTTNQTIKKYNKQFRHKDAATDVISFPYYETKKPGTLPKESKDEPVLGDIMLSSAYIAKDLINWPGQTLEERIVLLVVHSICHLLGYDHETDEEYAVMKAEEMRLLKLVE